jgi:protein-disulfide isomerase
MTSPAESRRERRAEQREAEREAQRRRRVTPQRPAWRSPLVLATVGAVIAGVVLIGALVLANRPVGSGTAIRPSDVRPVPAALVDGRSVGSAKAPITIELWSDFQCPICEQFATLLEPSLRATYIADGRVRLVYRDFAFIGQESVDAAAAARVAQKLGVSFWTFHDLLYANQGAENKGPARATGGYSRDRLADIAVAAGLDRAAFTAALADKSYADAVNLETSQGRALNPTAVESTPTLVINGTLYAGLPVYSKLTALLDGLAPAGSAAPASAAP